MKKLARKLTIYVTPFLILFLFFYMFEPYDYLGLKSGTAYNTKPLSAMREVINEKPSNIILGDSRLANLNTGYIEEITGESYTMLGFGGAQLGELIELFWFASKHTKLDRVVFGVSFYNAKGEQNAGRIPEIEQQATNIFSFTSRYDYWLQSVNGATDKTRNLVAGMLGRPDLMAEPPEDPTAFDTVQHIPPERGEIYRLQLETYAKEALYPMCLDYSLEQETLGKLDEIIKYCDKNSIELIFVFPPMHASVYTFVVEPLELMPFVNQIKEYLIARANVFDMEFLNEFTCNEDNYFDGMHLKSALKKTLADMLFTDIESEAIVRYYK